MSIITNSEVKSFLNKNDNYVENESVTFSSVSYSKLANKNGVTIIYVNADDDNSAAHTTAYTTNDYYTTVDQGGNFLMRRIDTGSIGDTQTVYVRYTYNQYDTRINDLIPIVERDLVDYLNNYFPDYNTRYSGSFLRILSSGPNIYDTENGDFEIEGFSAKKVRLIEAEGPEGGSLGEKTTESFGFLLNHISVSVGLDAITISWKIDRSLFGFPADLTSVKLFPLTRDIL